MTTGRPAPMPPCEELLDALRRNALLLRELSARYGVELQPERPSSAPEIHSWHDVWRLLGEEMAALAQEQLRVLLLDSQNRSPGSASSTKAASTRCKRGPPRCCALPSSRPSPKSSSCTTTPRAIRLRARRTLPSPRDIDRAADLLGIELLDHVVIGRKGAVSFLDRGMLDGAA